MGSFLGTITGYDSIVSGYDILTTGSADGNGTSSASISPPAQSGPPPVSFLDKLTVGAYELTNHPLDTIAFATGISDTAPPPNNTATPLSNDISKANLAAIKSVASGVGNTVVKTTSNLAIIAVAVIVGYFALKGK